MRKDRESRIIHKYSKKQILILGVLSLFMVSFIIILGRYVVNNVSNFFTRSKEFYFYSDKLSEDNPSYQIDNWPGVDNYTITVNMNSRKNNLLATSYDIPYIISYICTDNVICQLSKTSGTISADSNSDFFNLVITPNTSLKTGDRVHITIKATTNDIYKKTISARFTLVVGQEQLFYEIVDKKDQPYFELNITNSMSYYLVQEAFATYAVGDRINVDTYLALSEEEKKKCYSAVITLNFDHNKALLDMTNSNYLTAQRVGSINQNGDEYINEIEFRLDAISSTTVRFYKVDSSQDYTYPNAAGTPSVITVTIK